jgi:hypothetical protein
LKNKVFATVALFALTTVGFFAPFWFAVFTASLGRLFGL